MKLSYATSKNLHTHLEFLGYQIAIEEAEEGDQYDTYLAKANGKASLYFRGGEDFAYVRSHWNGFDPKSLKSKDFYQTLNDINAKSLLGTCYFQINDNDEVTIVISALYYGYEKATFSSFIELFTSEVTIAIQALQQFTI